MISCSPATTSQTSSSCTCNSIRDRRPSASIRRCTPSMATLMMSAALPWIGAFNAARSAISRFCRLSLVRSGTYRRRPKTVSVVASDPAEPREVGLHLLLRVLDGDLQLAGQAERRQSVGEAVGHRLDSAPQL